MGRYTAITAKRKNDYSKNLDYYPTPPRATHALCRWIGNNINVDMPELTVYEPAAGGGHMAEVLRGYFRHVITSDIAEYDYPLDFVADFVSGIDEYPQADWLITNPPFKLFDDFVLRAIENYPSVALLARLQALEGDRRFKMVWSNWKPNAILVFRKRIHMVRGRLPVKGDGSSAVAFAWFLWYDGGHQNTIIDWL